jgi:hypothetical protein
MATLTDRKHSAEQETGMSLETIISVGVFSWLAVGMVLMALGIW